MGGSEGRRLRAAGEAAGAEVAQAERTEVPRAAGLDLGPHEVLRLLGEPAEKVTDEQAVLAAYARLYAEHGGGVETDIKESKQGFGITK